MYQVYFFYSSENKWTENFNSYEDAVAKIATMKTELEARSSFTIIIIDPDGTQIQSVTK